MYLAINVPVAYMIWRFSNGTLILLVKSADIELCTFKRANIATAFLR